MKRFLQYLLVILFTFGLPLLTSWLLDIDWITENWSRSWLIYLLMLLEIVWGVYMAVILVKLNHNNQPK